MILNLYELNNATYKPIVDSLMTVYKYRAKNDELNLPTRRKLYTW